MADSSDTQALQAGEARKYTEVPRMGFLDTLRSLLANGGGRVDMLSTLRRLRAKHGRVVLQNSLPMRFVNLFGPDANRLVLVDRERTFSARRPWMLIMGRIFPNGLLLQDGDRHRRDRRIMQEAFKPPVLRDYLERMNPMIAAGIASWDRDGSTLMAFRAYKELTLNIAASIFLGVELGPKVREMNKAFEAMVAASMSRIRLRIPGTEFHRGLKGREFMMGYLGSMIDDRRRGTGTDMLTRLSQAESEDGSRLTDEEVIDHMIFLMMAAHDTTTSTLTSMTYELAKHRDWQERVRAESMALGKGAADFDDLDRLESLTWVMKETLRRYPPLPVIPRVATCPFEFGGYRLPEGVMDVVSPIDTHHMEEWWSRPFEFDPERFCPERAEHERHSHSYVPFGSGPHMCLGYRFAETQIRATVHQIVCRYRWSVPEGYEMPVQQAPISKPRDGLPIRIERLS